MAGGWRKLLNEVLHNLYFWSQIVMVIKRRMRWMGYIECIGKMWNGFTFFVTKQGKVHTGGLSIEGRIILNWLLEEQGVKTWTEFGSFMIGSSGVFLWKWWWTFGFHKNRGFLSTWISTFQGRTCIMDLK
jgi:hypothetical protein